MNRDLFKKAILLPVITGAVICVLFVLMMKSASSDLIPFNNGAVLASHDGLVAEQNANDTEKGYWTLEEVGKNALIGTAADLKLVYDADYSLLDEAASVMPGSADFDKVGCRYLKIINSNMYRFGSVITVEEHSIASWDYAFVEEYTVGSEQAALLVAPDYPSSLVVYYQISDGVGLTSEYNVMIYREVA